MSSVLDRLRQVWRDKIAGPTLRTYDAACDELGGGPWRELPDATDRWFLADRPKSLAGRGASPPLLPALESGSFDLRRRMSDPTKLALLCGGALLAIVVVVIALAHGSGRVSAPYAAPVAIAAPVVTAAPVVIAAPVATTSRSIASAAPVAVIAPRGAATSTLALAHTAALHRRHFAHRRRR